VQTQAPTVADLFGRSTKTCPLPFLRAHLFACMIPDDHIRGVLRANSLGFAPRPEVAVVGLWPLPAMCNHDDWPNATYTVSNDVLVLRAARDIDAGDEICITYTAWDALAADREERLREGWGIERASCGTEDHEAEVDQRAAVLSEWLADYRRQHGVRAAKDAIVEVCELFGPSAGPAAATAWRLQAAYCLHESDHRGVLHALRSLLDIARMRVPFGEHVVEYAVVLAVFACQIVGSAEEDAVPMNYNLRRAQALADIGMALTLCAASHGLGVADEDVTWGLICLRLRESIWLEMLGIARDLKETEARLRRLWREGRGA